MNLRKYVLPSVLILALGASLAIAQTFTRALQLSQDTTGAFAVDANNGIYFPGHILSTGTGRPAPSVTGIGTPTLAGTDVSGTVTMGTSGTSAIVTFGQAFLTIPACLAISQTVSTSISYSVNATSLTIQQPALTGNKVNYWCASAS